MSDYTLAEALRFLTGKGDVIAFDRRYVDLLNGSFKAAAFLSQCVHLQKQAHDDSSDFGDDDDAYWYKSQDQLYEETRLNAGQQRRVREKLQEHDWWHEQRQGMPASLHYKVDLPGLLSAIAPKESRTHESSSRASADSCSRASPTSRSQASPGSDAGADNAGASRSQTTTQNTSTETERDTSAPAHDPAPDETPDTGTPSPQTVSSYDEFFDGEARDVSHPVIPPDHFDRLWHNYMGESFGIIQNLQRRRAMAAGKYFTEDEIRDAMEVTKRQANRPSWGYFRAVLQSDSTEDDDHPETGGVDPEINPGLAEAKRRMKEGGGS